MKDILFHITDKFLKCPYSGLAPEGYDEIELDEFGEVRSKNGKLVLKKYEEGLFLGEEYRNSFTSCRIGYATSAKDMKLNGKPWNGDNRIIDFNSDGEIEIEYTYKGAGSEPYVEIAGGGIDSNYWDDAVFSVKYASPDYNRYNIHLYNVEVGTLSAWKEEYIDGYNYYYFTGLKDKFAGKYISNWIRYQGSNPIANVPQKIKFIKPIANPGKYPLPFINKAMAFPRLYYDINIKDWRNKCLIVYGTLDTPRIASGMEGSMYIVNNSSGSGSSKHLFQFMDLEDHGERVGKKYMAIFNMGDDIPYNGGIYTNVYWEDGVISKGKVGAFNVLGDGGLNFTYGNKLARLTTLKEAMIINHKLTPDEENEFIRKFLKIDNTPKPYVSFDFSKGIYDQCGNAKVLGYDKLQPRDSNIVEASDQTLSVQRLKKGIYNGFSTKNLANKDLFRNLIGDATVEYEGDNVFKVTINTDDTVYVGLLGSDYTEPGDISVGWEFLEGHIKQQDGNIYYGSSINFHDSTFVGVGESGVDLYNDVKGKKTKRALNVNDGNATSLRVNGAPIGHVIRLKITIEENPIVTPPVENNRAVGKFAIENFKDYRNKTIVIKGHTDYLYDVNYSGAIRVLIASKTGLDVVDGTPVHRCDAYTGITEPNPLDLDFTAVISYNEHDQTYGFILFEDGTKRLISTPYFNVNPDSILNLSFRSERWRPGQHLYNFDIYDQNLNDVLCDHLLQNGNFDNLDKVPLEDSCVFYTADGEVTDRVGDLTTYGYEKLSCKDVGYVDEINNQCSFQVVKLPNGKKALYGGWQTNNFLDGSIHSAYSNISCTEIRPKVYKVELTSSLPDGEAWKSYVKFKLYSMTPKDVVRNLSKVKVLENTLSGGTFRVATANGCNQILAGQTGEIKGRFSPHVDMDTLHFAIDSYNTTIDAGGYVILDLSEAMIEPHYTDNIRINLTGSPYVEKQRRRAGKICYDEFPVLDNFTLFQKIDLIEYHERLGMICFDQYHTTGSAGISTLLSWDSMNKTPRILLKDGLNWTDARYLAKLPDDMFDKVFYSYIKRKNKYIFTFGLISEDGSYRSENTFDWTIYKDIVDKVKFYRCRLMGYDFYGWGPSHMYLCNTSMFNKVLNTDEINDLVKRGGYLNIPSKGEYKAIPYSTPRRDEFGAFENHHTVTDVNKFELPIRKGYIAKALCKNGYRFICDMDTMISTYERSDGSEDSFDLVAGGFTSGNFFKLTNLADGVPYTVKYFKKFDTK